MEEQLEAVFEHSRTSPVVLEDRVIVSLRGPAVMMALDRCTGSLIWQKQMDTHPFAVLTMSPTAENGVIYQGFPRLKRLQS